MEVLKFVSMIQNNFDVSIHWTYNNKIDYMMFKIYNGSKECVCELIEMDWSSRPQVIDYSKIVTIIKELFPYMKEV